MSWAVAGGLAAGGLASAFGSPGGFSSKQYIAPGLSDRNAHNLSMDAYRRSQMALYGQAYDPHGTNPYAGVPSYTGQMQGLIGQAQQAGQGIYDLYGQADRRMQGAFGQQDRLYQQAGGDAQRAAQRATQDAMSLYSGYGQGAQQSIQDAYQRQIGNIDQGRAMARTRGNFSGDDMLAAGQRREAMQGYNQSMTGLAGQQAQLMGGALERGRSQELGVRQGYDQQYMNALGQRPGAQAGMAQLGMQARQNQFGLPAQLQQQLYGQQFQTQMSPQMLYPTHAPTFMLGGGGYQPQSNPLSQFVSGAGGLLAGYGVNQMMYPQGGR
ncbi:MAG: hypothetical protein ACIAQU_04400 [Phycisphaerales bacterium JB064]